MKSKQFQLGLNIFLCLFFFDFTLHEIHRSLTGEAFRYGWAWYDIYTQFDWWNANWQKLSLLDISFRAQNILMALMILFRSIHREVNTRFIPQTVALLAFFSGAFLPGIGEGIKSVGAIIAMTANVIGILSLLSLNRSFGILIARREIKTNGLYRMVRHPMYVSDILLRVGFVVGYFSWMNLLLLIVSGTLYVMRARYEEKFLAQKEEYRAYQHKVKYRFIPGVY